MTKTRWLLYSSMLTATCGFLRNPSPNWVFSASSSDRSVSPAAFTRPISGKVKRAVRFDRELSREVGVVVHGHRQDVLRADYVVGLCTGRLRRGERANTGEHERDGNLHHGVFIP